MQGAHLAELLLTRLESESSLVALEDEFGTRLTRSGLLSLAYSYSVPLGVASAAVDTEHEASAVARAVACVLGGVAYVPVVPGESLPVATASARLSMGPSERQIRRVSNVAYLLRTSGTTGAPKFVIQGYHEAGYHALTYAASIRLSAADRIALLASLTTDASLMDMFGGLISGATVCMFNPRRKAWMRLAGWVLQQSITVLHMTPTLLRWAFENEHGENTRTVRCVVLGGEPATGADLALMRRAFPHAELVNGYGPSECTMALQWRARSVESFEHDESLPIGSPIGETKAKVLDSGELLLSGPGIFWGYYSCERLTDEAFLGIDGVRWYRTGDAVARSNGHYVWRSRLDGRVKVKGAFAPGDLGLTMKEACRAG